MKREAVNTSFLLAITCLLVYVAVLLTQKPNLQDIDARIEYWHNFYNVEMKRVQRQRLSTEEPDHDSSAEISSADSVTNVIKETADQMLKTESDSRSSPAEKKQEVDEP